MPGLALIAARSRGAVYQAGSGLHVHTHRTQTISLPDPDPDSDPNPTANLNSNSNHNAVYSELTGEVSHHLVHDVHHSVILLPALYS